MNGHEKPPNKRKRTKRMIFANSSTISWPFNRNWQLAASTGGQKVSKMGMHCTAGKILCGSCDDLFGELLGKPSKLASKLFQIL